MQQNTFNLNVQFSEFWRVINICIIYVYIYMYINETIPQSRYREFYRQFITLKSSLVSFLVNHLPTPFILGNLCWANYFRNLFLMHCWTGWRNRRIFHRSETNRKQKTKRVNKHWSWCYPYVRISLEVHSLFHENFGKNWTYARV